MTTKTPAGNAIRGGWKNDAGAIIPQNRSRCRIQGFPEGVLLHVPKPPVAAASRKEHVAEW